MDLMSLLKRDITQQLTQWKSKDQRNPLILWGARQVGKSTSIEAFGSEFFSGCHTFNFQKNLSLKSLFAGDLNPEQILRGLALTQKREIAPTDLLFFDEVQECPEALTSLKYFCERLPGQAIIAAGSHLGLVKTESAFPVGKVEFLSLHPLTFFEFLQNLDPQTHEILAKQPLLSEDPIPAFYHERALKWLRLYQCVGGLPASVKAFASANPDREIEGIQEARTIQTRLIEGYQSDFSKHAGTVNASHILRVFESIANQLGKAQGESVRRFRFSQVIPKKKGFEAIEGPLTWLEKSRLVIKTSIANRFEPPIKAYTQHNFFKIYLFDIGILNAMLDIPIESLLMENLGAYKGYLAENLVAQALFAATDRPLTAWTEGQSEIEFVVTRGSELCPIEVKASNRSRQAKSLRALIDRYHPELSIKITGQNRGYLASKKLLTLPIYLTDLIPKNTSARS